MSFALRMSTVRIMAPITDSDQVDRAVVRVERRSDGCGNFFRSPLLTMGPFPNDGRTRLQNIDLQAAAAARLTAAVSSVPAGRVAACRAQARRLCQNAHLRRPLLYSRVHHRGKRTLSSFAFSSKARQMCTGDAFRLCSSEIPDIARITACIRRNKANVGQGCRAMMDQEDAAASKARVAATPVEQPAATKTKPVQAARVEQKPTTATPVEHKKFFFFFF